MQRVYPRVLVINGTPIGYPSNTGVTLQRLFDGWQSDRLLQVCYFTGDSPSGIQFDMMRFPPQTAPVDWIMRKLLRSLPMNLPKTGVGGMNANISEVSLKGKLHDFVRALLDNSPIRVSADLLKQVDAFQPQVIYSNLGGLRILKTVLFFAQRYDIRIVGHFMDDWQSTIYTSSPLTSWAHRKVDQQIRRCLKRSVCSVGISEYMAETYQTRYGVPFTWASNPIDAPETLTPPPTGSKFVLTYSGGLHLNRWKSLEVVAEVLERLNQEGHQTALAIYTGENHRAEFQPKMKPLSVLEWRGQVKPEEIPAVLSASHVVIHVESFDPALVNYTRYSFSTKLSEYLASGRPVLAYAPAGIATTHYLDKYGAGLIADTPEALEAQIRRLIDDADLCRQLGEKGRAAAMLHHVRESVHARLVDTVKANLRDAH